MRKRKKVVIVGAGPAGCACACTLARLGIGEITLIDKAVFPRRKPCAGGLGPGTENYLDAIGVRDRVLPQANVVTALRAITPSGKELHIGGVTKAHVLPRSKFDHLLFEYTKSLGIEVITGQKVVSFLGNEECPEGVVTDKGTSIEAIWTVIATGSRSGLIAKGKKQNFSVLKSIIVEYENLSIEPSTIEMYFDREIAPFYGWVFPEGGNTANIGICFENNRTGQLKPLWAFKNFARRYLGDRISSANRLTSLEGSAIYTTFDPRDIARPGLLVIGEAGALVNPATGEGIRQALFSGIEAGESIALHLSGKASAAQSAEKYEKRIKTGLVPELIAGEFFKMVSSRIFDIAILTKNMVHWTRRIRKFLPF